MKVTFLLFQRSHYELSRDISWAEHTKKGYIIRDPVNSNELLYLTESEYNKLLRVMLSNESSLDVIATPRDTPMSVLRKFPDLSKEGQKSPFIVSTEKFSKDFLFDLIPGWKLKESMISVEGNFDLFILSYYNHILGWMGMKSSSVNKIFIRKLGKQFALLLKTRGINQVILIMKITSICILQYISGNPMSHTQELGQRIKLINGLPAFLPINMRRLLRTGNILYTRVLVSLFSSYKGLVGKYGKPDLSSITAPRFSLKEFIDNTPLNEKGENMRLINYDFSDFYNIHKAVPLFWDFINPSRIKCDFSLDPSDLPLISTASPTHNTSWMSAPFSALYHDMKDTPLMEYLHAVCSGPLGARNIRVDGVQEFILKIRYFASLYKAQIPDLYQSDPLFTSKNAEEAVEKVSMGKLAIKEEAAGKIRVFAISDYWTQVALRPLQDSMFDILKLVPSDATFNQLGKVEEFSSKHHDFIASYDLKSATDLIPQSLYTSVLRPWMNSINPEKDIVNLWMKVLVDRDYLFKEKDKSGQETITKYRYSRGQPMGTLSSWSSLAIVHHFLVFYAAWRINRQSFRDYLVLGDDIIIGDKDVAQSYTSVCRDHGITIGFAKSFVSNKEFFQFASQNILGHTNLSPISLKEVLSIQLRDRFTSVYSGITSVAAKAEFVNRLAWKGFITLDNPLNMIRAVSSPRTWRLFSRDLSRGIIPSRMVNALLCMLSSPLQVEKNTFSVSQLMAALRQDINCLCKRNAYPISDQIRFISELILFYRDKFNKEFDDICRTHKSLKDCELYHKFPLIATKALLSEIFEAEDEFNILKLQLLEDEFERVIVSLEEAITENNIRDLLFEEDGELWIPLDLTALSEITRLLAELSGMRLSYVSKANAKNVVQGDKIPPLIRSFIAFRDILLPQEERQTNVLGVSNL